MEMIDIMLRVAGVAFFGSFAILILTFTAIVVASVVREWRHRE